MAKPITTPNIFANATTATGAQLDADIAVAVNAINDPYTYSNYLVDTGSVTNAYAVAFTGASAVASIVAGLRIDMYTTRANAGPSTLSINGLTPLNIINPDGTSLASNQIPANSIVTMFCDGVGNAQLQTLTRTSAQSAAATPFFVKQFFPTF